MLAAQQLGAALAHRAGRLELGQVLLAAQVLADRHEFHLGGDDALARVVHLGHVGAVLGAARLAVQLEAHGAQLRVVQARLAVQRGGAGQLVGVAALEDPRQARGRQAGADVDRRGRVRVRARGVVHVHRRIGLGAERGRGVGQADLAHRHADVGAAALGVHLARIGERGDGRLVHDGGGGIELQWCIHYGSLGAGASKGGWSGGAHGRCLTGFPSLALSRSGSEGVSHRPAAMRRAGPLACAGRLSPVACHIIRRARRCGIVFPIACERTSCSTRVEITTVSDKLGGTMDESLIRGIRLSPVRRHHPRGVSHDLYRRKCNDSHP